MTEMGWFHEICFLVSKLPLISSASHFPTAVMAIAGVFREFGREPGAH